MEAAKIDAFTYSRITDVAAMYRILAAVHLHRPAPVMHFPTMEEMKTHKSAYWRLADRYDGIRAASQDPRRFRMGDTLKHLDCCLMPTGKKTQRWLHQADNAVSISFIRSHELITNLED